MAIRWILFLVLIISMRHAVEARVLLGNGSTYKSASKGNFEVDLSHKWGYYNGELVAGQGSLVVVDKKRAVPGGPDPQHHF